MKKTYKIEVDCANCANLMELAAGKIPGVASVAISFMTQKMSIEFENGANESSVLKQISKACKKIDSDFEIEL